ncbi:Diphthamide biosynthesis protein 3 [Candidozyma auris]|nr:hypothetical protein QG37_05077 [[Candida] auris]
MVTLKMAANGIPAYSRADFEKSSSVLIEGSWSHPQNLMETVTVYDEIEIEDFVYDPNTGLFQYPCPCGDKFAISLDDLKDGEDIAVCPSCSLMVRVIFEEEDLVDFE